jgi:hypothetical protein
MSRQRPRACTTTTYHTNDSDTLVPPVLDTFLPRIPIARGHVPVGAVQHLAFEVLQPRDIGPRPAAQPAHACEKHVYDIFELLELAFGATRLWPTDGEVPFTLGIVPTRGDELM